MMDKRERKLLQHIWHQMIRRCTDPKNKAFKNYGGRGITVCARWVESFNDFLADIGPRPPGYLIDRTDNDAGYSPENCRWVTRKQSADNRRSVTWVIWEGERMCIKDAAIRAGASYRMVRKRVANGMDPIEAIQRPSRLDILDSTKQARAAIAKAQEESAFWRRTYFKCGHDKESNSMLTSRGFRACRHCATKSSGNYFTTAAQTKEAA